MYTVGLATFATSPCLEAPPSSRWVGATFECSCSAVTMSHLALFHLQEQVAECRELNSTEVWLAVASAVNPLCQSMPLLLHHQVKRHGMHSTPCIRARACKHIGFHSATHSSLAVHESLATCMLLLMPAMQCVCCAAHACRMMCRPTTQKQLPY